MIRIKKLNLLCIIGLALGCGLIFGLGNAQAQTTVNNISRSATLRAWLPNTHDYIPPVAPVLIEPQGNTCNRQPVFGWKETTDNIAVAHYHFKLLREDGSAFLEVNNITGDVENNNYQIWLNRDGYHLKIKKNLDFGKYTWWVGAIDYAGNETTSAVWHLDYLAENCRYDCSLSPNRRNFSLTSPSGEIDNLRPVIRFSFDPTNNPGSFDVAVDGQTVFNGVPITNLLTNSYLVNVSNNTVTFQARSDYLPSKTGENVSYQVRVTLHDNQSCNFAATNTVNFNSANAGAGGTSPSVAPVPVLISPPNGGEVGSLTPTLSWRVCGVPECLSGFSVNINGVSVPNSAVSTSVNNFVADCGGPATIYNVNTSGLNNIRYNNAADPADVNTWQVSVTNRNNLTASSPTWTFKVWQYFWCTAARTCRAGNKDDCGRSGMQCFTAENSCLSAAAETCTALLSSGSTQEEDGATATETGGGFLGGLLTLGEEIGQIVANALAVGAAFFPVVSLIGLLPIGILIIIFPQPQGFVFDSRTLKPIRDALLSLDKQGQTIKAWLSNKHGLYRGVKLEEGTYQISVSRENYLFPSQIPRRRRRAIKNYYLGEEIVVKSYREMVLTYLIPLDDETLLTDEEKREAKPKLFDRLRLFCLRFINSLFWLYGLSFIIVIIVALIDPTWLNLLILLIYFIGWCRRVWMMKPQVNVLGRVTSKSGQSVANREVTVKLVAGEKLAAVTETGHKGDFTLYLNPGSIYEITVAGGEVYTLEASPKKQTVTIEIA